MPSFHPAQVYGGPIQSVYALCRHLTQQGCDVRVLTTNANGPSAVLEVPTGRQIELDDHVPVRYCRRYGSGSFSPELLRHLPASFRWADVVHLTAVYSFPVIPALLAARLAHKPVVWSPRGSLTFWEGRRRKLAKRAWELACRAVRPSALALHVTSEQEASDCRRKFASVPSVVIANGVELVEGTTHHQKSGLLRLLYIGRLHPMKGLENLIEACALLNPAAKGCGSGLNVRLTIVGRGEPGYTRYLELQIAARGLAERVRMTGELTGAAKEAALADSDLLVLPSYSENFGMVIAEALARGLPVIASHGTPWARVEEMKCGLWVSNDPLALATAIRRVAAMPLEEMGAKGRAWMRAEFGWASCAAQMLRLYREMSKASAAPASPRRWLSKILAPRWAGRN
jgi:glycosyltransferase involved in cell wall biosynthesis